MSTLSSLTRFLPVAAFAGAAAFIVPAQAAQSQSHPANIAGSYRCAPQPSTCDWSGQSFTVTQTGDALEVKNNKGDTGHGTVTSAITAELSAPWNMFGTLQQDGKTIEWSNGTEWTKL